MFKSAEIASLQARISELETSLESANGIETSLRAEFNDAKASITEKDAKISELAAAVTAAETKASAAEASIEAQVNERLASAGVDPVKRDPSAREEAHATMSRADFKKLPAAKANAFIREGGRLTD